MILSSSLANIFLKNEKKDLVGKINELSWVQIHGLRNYLPKETFNDSSINFNIENFNPKTLLKLYEFVNECVESNSKNPLHQRWIDHKNVSIIEEKSISNTVNNVNDLLKTKNFLLNDNDEDISESLSSSSISKIKINIIIGSLSDFERKKLASYINERDLTNFILNRNMCNDNMEIDEDNFFDDKIFVDEN